MRYEFIFHLLYGYKQYKISAGSIYPSKNLKFSENNRARNSMNQQYLDCLQNLRMFPPTKSVNLSMM
jgi:hypothetical protein